MVLLGKDFRVVRRGSPATDAFIMCHEYLPNKVLYDQEDGAYQIIRNRIRNFRFGQKLP